ncbi:hypothetical protein [Burkholderia multivorans]|uniref:hypothetical protein n=1 Tax=Burkholderia multivorans TaxID=87883 RepID=UPI0021578058|nr:hypothetical protein [Burkholderia multivorans]
MPRRSAGSGLLFRYTRIPRPETDPAEKSENPDPNRQSGAKVGIDFIDAGEIAETREHAGCFNCIRQCGAGLTHDRGNVLDALPCLLGGIASAELAGR